MIPYDLQRTKTETKKNIKAENKELKEKLSRIVELIEGSDEDV